MANKITVRIDYTMENSRGTKRCSYEFSAPEASLEKTLERSLAKLEERGAYSIEVRYESKTIATVEEVS